MDSRIAWDRVEALTEQEIEAAARSDPDAPPRDGAFRRMAPVVAPSRVPARGYGPMPRYWRGPGPKGRDGRLA